MSGSKLPCKTQPDVDSGYAFVVCNLWVSTREDPLRVRYLSCPCGSDIPTRDVSEIVEKEELSGGVHKVRVLGDETPEVYKTVERPFYVPPDSEVLEQELLILGSLRGNTIGIAQLIAAVVSNNPYQTSQLEKNSDPVVLRGILLEYHPHGISEDALKVFNYQRLRLAGAGPAGSSRLPRPLPTCISED